jgi:hypothetical protein
MSRFSQSRYVLPALVALVVLAVSGCGASTATASPGGGGGVRSPASNGNGAGNGGGPSSAVVSGLAGLAGNFGSVTSYRFTLTMIGVPGSDTLNSLGGPSDTNDTAISMSGTVVSKPSPAFDITMGTVHEVQVGGTDYIDVGTGAFMPSQGSGNLNAFSPAAMYASMIEPIAADFTKVGTGKKNGVDADHYQATAAASSRLDSIAGTSGAKWTADVWIAQNGAYPVSMAITGTVGGKVAFQIKFDVTNVNDPANVVAAPVNPT